MVMNLRTTGIHRKASEQSCISDLGTEITNKDVKVTCMAQNRLQVTADIPKITKAFMIYFQQY